MSVEALSNGLTEEQFQHISRVVKDLCGINLHDGKRQLVKARLTKRLRALGLPSFEHYINYVASDGSGAELTAMLDALSTNLTSLFRERKHFDHLAENVLPQIAAKAPAGGGRLRIWSAGCSSGEEPYSIAVIVREAIGDIDRWDARILATDLSTKVLAQARRGVYEERRVEPVPPGLRARYFTRADADGKKLYRAGEALRRMVVFARLNLMDPWPMKGPFDVIFCRNVMIYFDKPTQGRLIQRFYDILRPGGVLYIGHSESLTRVDHGFRYLAPTVYGKP